MNRLTIAIEAPVEVGLRASQSRIAACPDVPPIPTPTLTQMPKEIHQDVAEAEFGTFPVRMNRCRYRDRQSLANDRAPMLPARLAGAVQSLCSVARCFA